MGPTKASCLFSSFWHCDCCGAIATISSASSLKCYTAAMECMGGCPAYYCHTWYRKLCVRCAIMETMPIYIYIHIHYNSTATTKYLLVYDFIWHSNILGPFAGLHFRGRDYHGLCNVFLVRGSVYPWQSLRSSCNKIMYSPWSKGRRSRKSF